MIGTPAGERTQQFLRERTGEAFCAACLGRELTLTPFEAQNVVWTLQESPGFVLHSAQCASCLRNKRVLTAAPEKAVVGPEAAVVGFLLGRRGEPFCDACVAFAADLSLQDARRAIGYLEPLHEFSGRTGECSACGRTKTVVVALVSGPEETATRGVALSRMVTGTVHYRGWRIDILSYEMQEGWRPFVAIQSPLRLIVPASPSVFREAFPTRAEADEFALQRAREWIDKRH
ncbi:MAG TPA: hypothetical protein VGU22_06250 [Methylomirabilota bacterium]|jgi:hypothetical protein|nr:hypothetical protein [Methylomirabilota bacterium]